MLEKERQLQSELEVNEPSEQSDKMNQTMPMQILRRDLVMNSKNVQTNIDYHPTYASPPF